MPENDLIPDFGPDDKGQVGLMDHVEAGGTRQWIETSGGAVRWRTWGTGPDLLLVHGGHGSWLHWLRNIPALSRTRTVHCLDMPGYGASAAPPKGLDMTGYAALVSQAIDRSALGQSRFSVCAFSMGGLVAAHACAPFHDRIDRLVLVGAAGFVHRTRASLPELIDWRALPDEPSRTQAHRQNLATMMYHDAGRIDDLAVEIQKRNTENSRQAGRRLVRSSSLAAAFAAQPLPLAGLWGEFDILSEGVPNRIAQLHTWDDSAPCTVIPDAGHWVQSERPEAFNAALTTLLDRDAPPETSTRLTGGPAA